MIWVRENVGSGSPQTYLANPFSLCSTCSSQDTWLEAAFTEVNNDMVMKQGIY